MNVLVRPAWPPDIDTVLSMYSPDLKWHGGNEFGAPTDFESRDDFFGMFMRSFEVFDESTMELVDATPVGDSLVAAHVRAHRRVRDTQQVADFDFVMAFRVENGQVTHGWTFWTVTPRTTLRR